MLNVKLNALRRKDKADPLGLLYWNRDHLHYLNLFRFVYTVVLTDYFMLMVVLMVMHVFLLACKREHLFSSSLRPEICCADRMAGLRGLGSAIYSVRLHSWTSDNSFCEKSLVQK